MINEAFYASESSLAGAEDIDRCCVKGLGFPLGPLAAADAFGRPGVEFMIIGTDHSPHISPPLHLTDPLSFGYIFSIA